MSTAPRTSTRLVLVAWLATACSTGYIADEGSSSFGSYSGGDQGTAGTDEVGTGDASTTASSSSSSSDDSNDPCGGMTPCQDATDDIPITGGAGSGIVPSSDVDLATWAAAAT